MFLRNIFSILIIITTQYQSTYPTECFRNSRGWCEFRNIKTTNEQPLFQPTVGGSQPINRILFTDCEIPVLTTEICSSFPNLIRFDVEQIQLGHLNTKALENCTRLSYISFFNNKLQVVNRDTFKRNTGLRYISFSWNQLTHIDMSTFSHLYVLEELALDNNRITVIDFRLVGELLKMSVMHLSSNLLIQLNEKTLLQRFPRLRRIFIEDNLFPCDRVATMLEEFHTVNVTIGKGHSYKRLDVHYDRKLVQDIECLDNQAYSEMLAARFGTKFEPEILSVMEKVEIVEEKVDSKICWYIGGGVTFLLVIFIASLSYYYFCHKRNRQESPNADYYYDYQTQRKFSEETHF